MLRSSNVLLEETLDTRKCWRLKTQADIVMFHGYYDQEFIPHSHDVMTAILVTAGTVKVTVDRIIQRVGAGQMILVGAHQVQSASPVDGNGWRIRSLHFPPSLLVKHDDAWRTAKGMVSFANPVCGNRGPDAALFYDLHCASEATESAAQQERLLQSLTQWFLENTDSFGPRMPWVGHPDIRLERARHILASTLFERTMLDSVAEQVGFSTYSLIRRFTERYGLSPHAWRMQARAGEAAKLLIKKDAISNVAMKCGFSDQSHLTRIFKKVYGVTPGEYGLMD
jgi:AraC-like DNA-binding protein/quercetin dioxygenase-like cupin family protein